MNVSEWRPSKYFTMWHNILQVLIYRQHLLLRDFSLDDAMYETGTKVFGSLLKNITSQKKKMTENDKCTDVEKYVGEIKGGLRPSMKITIMGMIYPSPKSFSVTLLCDPKDDHTTRDIGLLLVVNFTEKSIVRNSQIAGKWGKEEKTIPYFPFTAEDSFKMELLCEHQQIRILLDGRQLCSFSHRVQPVQRMTVLQISGDLKLTKVA